MKVSSHAAPCPARLAVRSALRGVAAFAAALVLAHPGLAFAADKTPAEQPQQPAAAPASPQAKADGSYSLGVSIGNQLRDLGLSLDTVSLDRVVQGMREALQGSAKSSPADNEQIGALVEGARSALGTRNKAEGEKFLAENSKKKGIVSTQSGLQYRVIAPGKGAHPKLSDHVTVHYKGTLLDGTQFDSSLERGAPASFPVNGVIPGWQEALQLMKPGAKWEVFIPAELAYDMNSPPPIPPGSVLHFEVELLDVKSAPPGESADAAQSGGTASPEGPAQSGSAASPDSAPPPEAKKD